MSGRIVAGCGAAIVSLVLGGLVSAEGQDRLPRHDGHDLEPGDPPGGLACRAAFLALDRRRAQGNGELLGDRRPGFARRPECGGARRSRGFWKRDSRRSAVGQRPSIRDMSTATTPQTRRAESGLSYLGGCPSQSSLRLATRAWAAVTAALARAMAWSIPDLTCSDHWRGRRMVGGLGMAISLELGEDRSVEASWNEVGQA